MIDPFVLLDALVLRFRDIPTLVQQLDNDAQNITYYLHSSKETDLQQFVLDMAPPRLLIAWQGDGVFRSATSAGLWEHRFVFAIKAADETNVPIPRSITNIWREMMNGTVAAWGMNIRRKPVYEAQPGEPLVDLMPPPTIERRTLFPSEQTRLDYMEGLMRLIEIGDPT